MTISPPFVSLFPSFFADDVEKKEKNMTKKKIRRKRRKMTKTKKKRKKNPSHDKIYTYYNYGRKKTTA
jgi:hypothetical protein